LHILATNLTKGCLTSFGQREILHFPSERRKSMITVQAGLTSIASAVTASSAYPALFPPLSLTHEEVGAREDEFEKQFFTDAGVTDNLGVHAFDWDELESAQSILVSDAGQSFVVPHGSEFGFIKTA
jgi:predicted acylesterase/phospholipase RssA